MNYNWFLIKILEDVEITWKMVIQERLRRYKQDLDDPMAIEICEALNQLLESTPSLLADPFKLNSTTCNSTTDTITVSTTNNTSVPCTDSLESNDTSLIDNKSNVKLIHNTDSSSSVVNCSDDNNKFIMPEIKMECSIAVMTTSTSTISCTSIMPSVIDNVTMNNKVRQNF